MSHLRLASHVVLSLCVLNLAPVPARADQPSSQYRSEIASVVAKRRADRQAQARFVAQRQAETAQQQAAEAQLGLAYVQYQTALQYQAAALASQSALASQWAWYDYYYAPGPYYFAVGSIYGGYGYPISNPVSTHGFPGGTPVHGGVQVPGLGVIKP
jgi:hypothetical protein